MKYMHQSLIYLVLVRHVYIFESCFTDILFIFLRHMMLNENTLVALKPTELYKIASL